MKQILTFGVVFLMMSFNSVCASSIQYLENKEDPVLDETNTQSNKDNSKDLLLTSTSAPLAQNVSVSSRGFSLTIAPNYSSIHNNELFSNNELNAKGGFGFNISLDFFSKINRNGMLKVGVGIGYSQFISSISIESFSDSVETVDVDGQKYMRNITLDDYTEKFTVGLIDIPVFLEFGNQNIDKIGFYGRFGIKFSFPISDNLTREGSLTTTGFYQDCPVTLAKIPELRFYDSESVNISEINTNLNSIVLSAFLSAGLSVPISNTLLVKFGVNINIGLSDIAEEEGSGKYTENKSVILSYTPVTLRSFGGEIGLIYTLRLD